MLNALLHFDFRSIAITLIAVIASMSVHEAAHGLVSSLFGDDSARARGRISLNPFRHIDWVGLLSLMLFGFGWAKPVPVDPRQYKDPKTGMIWTAFAGPAANFLLSFLCVFLFEVLAVFASGFASGAIGSFIISTLVSTAMLSAGFGIFNLIPIPPLDGARIFWAFLPDDKYFELNNPPAWMNMLFLLVIFSGLLNTPLGLMRQTLIGWMENVSLTILSLF